MTKKKYVRYTVIADFGTVNYETESYKDAFSKYQRSERPKTMYGFDEQDNISVILSNLRL
jgi:hypothetical protein